jgi:alpha-L-fucosidase
VGGKLPDFQRSWGYYRDEYSWKSVEQLLLMLIDSVAKAATCCLSRPDRGVASSMRVPSIGLHGMGEWMKRHSRSIMAALRSAQVEAARITRFDLLPASVSAFMCTCCVAFSVYTSMVQSIRWSMPSSLTTLRNQDRARTGHEVHAAGEGVHQGSLALETRAKADATIPVIELFLK